MCTVLVISDDYLTKEKVGELLGGLQLPAVVATTEFEVTRACISKRPGIVIADIETTGGVGFESIATARRLAREAYIIKACGADEYVPGRLSLAALMSAIETCSGSDRD
jgi:DNA-binding NarL/FixJ family response regulator